MSYSIEERLLHINDYSRPGIKLNKVSGLVIHWTANTSRGADAISNRNYFDTQDQRQSYASAHYVVDQDRIIRCIPETEMAYHVGALQYNQNTLNLLNTTYPNDCTIGIEWCVNEGNDFNETWNKVAWLAADICRRYGLDPMTHMIRHYDVTWKDCPHFFTPNAPNGEEGWAKFRASVKALMSGQNPSIDDGKPMDAIGEVFGTDADGLHVRAIPSSSSEARYTLHNGDKIHIVEYLEAEGHGWYKTTYGPLGGYVWSQYVKIVPQNDSKTAPQPQPQPAAQPKPPAASNKPTPQAPQTPQKSKYTFEDIGDYWGADSIQYLHDLDIINGMDENGHKVYKPNNPITRGEVAVVLARAVKYLLSQLKK
jgi:uncharacterized protein YgiM (DUF1202 family)